MNLPISKWFPVANTSDLPYRHIFQGQLLGREYAIWRADDGNINIWENRCLHRGVRLSIGTNEGSELKCQYHGWRYANRTAGCTYIPAHPADAPARTICNNSYACREKYGMIWTSEDPIGTVPELQDFSAYTVLRSIPINTAYKNIENFLLSVGIPDHNLLQYEENGMWLFKKNSGTLISLIIQPQTGNNSVIRGIYNKKPAGKEKIKVLKYYNFVITRIRDEIEKKQIPNIPEIEPKITKLDPALAKVPDQTDRNQRCNLRVVVSEKARLSDSIVKLNLTSINKQLPTFHAGAHIDVKLQNGSIRQYSLTNGPGETNYYSIAVKIEKNGKGSSQIIAENVSVGDVIAISSPHNNFPLLRNSNHTIFIAGGIGLTPLLSMAKVLHSMHLSFEFHYFTQSRNRFAFQKDFQNFTDFTITYTDLTNVQTLSKIKSILDKPKASSQIYVCGPGSMIQRTIETGLNSGWNEENIRYEYFKNNNKIDLSSNFRIDLARSAISIEVPSGKSILEILRENGINLKSSCEQGACGTCKVRVLEGEVNHQDVFLNSKEKARGDIMLTCVSRAKSKRLILDI